MTPIESTSVPRAAAILVKTSIEGCTMLFTAPNDLAAWRAQRLASREPDTIAWIGGFGMGDVLVDVGANVGACTALGDKWRGMRVFACEPEAQNYALLNRKIAVNGIGNLAVAYRLALSDRAGLDRLFLSNGAPGSSCHSLGESLDQKNRPREPGFTQGCMSATLDDRVAAGELPVPNHVKVDVDGIDPKVIAGADAGDAGGKIRSRRDQHRPGRPLGSRRPDARPGVRVPPGPGRRGAAQVRHVRRSGQRCLSTLSRRALQRCQRTVARGSLSAFRFENAFAKEFYAALLRKLPPTYAFRRLDATGTVSKGAYPDRYICPQQEAEEDEFRRGSGDFWERFHAWTGADALPRLLLHRFGDAMRARYGEDVAVRLSSESGLARECLHYDTAPHTGAPRKLVWLLFWLPADDRLCRLGTLLCVPRDPARRFQGPRHHDFADFLEVATAQFRPNALRAFFKTDLAFHGVEPSTDPGIERNLVPYNLYPGKVVPKSGTPVSRDWSVRRAAARPWRAPESAG